MLGERFWFLKVTNPRRASNENSTYPFISEDNDFFA